MHNSMTILLRLVVDLLRQRGQIDMYHGMWQILAWVHGGPWNGRIP